MQHGGASWERAARRAGRSPGRSTRAIRRQRPARATCRSCVAERQRARARRTQLRGVPAKREVVVVNLRDLPARATARQRTSVRRRAQRGYEPAAAAACEGRERRSGCLQGSPTRACPPGAPAAPRELKVAAYPARARRLRQRSAACGCAARVATATCAAAARACGGATRRSLARPTYGGSARRESARKQRRRVGAEGAAWARASGLACLTLCFPPLL